MHLVLNRNYRAKAPHSVNCIHNYKSDMRYRPPKQMRHTFATLYIGIGKNIT